MATIAKPTFLRTLVHQIKNAVREQHPNSRNPVSSPAYPADWSVAWRKMGRAAGLYVPMAGAVLFWPYAVRAAAKPGGFGHAGNFGGPKAWWE
ncbi:hypothetical protein GTA08_BOTSDO13321 [Neofusicoccum parvum]|uniref:Uncharacterized protein n=1 Tax=Neofusicoccum parvum TaxID=310453 RepID=A0ACB5RPK8_9PEZI|nr:hypothetical protein GTA08_BOTSDO13321 [Neofusicoccum parvum]GME64685.1 hypothetical protein GTA08_BOTSDO13321 [Neofusicoccum parvum]